jgi:hypothetical protein
VSASKGQPPKGLGTKIGSMDYELLFILDEARFRLFTDLLDAPPVPNAGLERLLAVKPPWATDADLSPG